MADDWKRRSLLKSCLLGDQNGLNCEVREDIRDLTYKSLEGKLADQELS